VRSSLRSNAVFTALLLVIEVPVLVVADTTWLRWIAIVGIVLAVVAFFVNERRRRRERSHTD